MWKLHSHTHLHTYTHTHAGYYEKQGIKRSINANSSFHQVYLDLLQATRVPDDK
jgi:hypothetical protein